LNFNTLSAKILIDEMFLDFVTKNAYIFHEIVINIFVKQISQECCLLI